MMELRAHYAPKFIKVFQALLLFWYNLILADYIEEHAEFCGKVLLDAGERQERARVDLGKV